MRSEDHVDKRQETQKICKNFVKRRKMPNSVRSIDP